VLHNDDFGSICSDDVPSVNESPGKCSANERKDEEADIGAIIDRGGVFPVDVLSKGDLEKLATLNGGWDAM
jgi:hypothetical protein